MKIRARLGRWFQRCIHQYHHDSESDRPELCISSNKVTAVGDNSIGSNNQLSFTLTPAHGGAVLTFRKYDERTDRNLYTNYIVRDDGDTAQEIGQIIAMEMIKL